LTDLLPYILFEKCIYILASEMASPRATGTAPVVGYLHAFDLRRRRAQVQIAAATLSGNSLRQTVHIHRASVHQVARVTAGLAESNGSLPPGL